MAANVVMASLFSLVSRLAFLALGWTFVIPRVLLDSQSWTSEQRNKLLVKIIFAYTFMESCVLFELVLFEIIGLGDERVRWWQWKVNLSSLLLLSIGVIPFTQFYIAFASRSREFLKRIAVPAASALFCVYLYLFYLMGAYIEVHQDSQGNAWMTAGLARVALVGVTMCAALSGYGAVNTPYSSLSFFVRKVTDFDLYKVEQSLIQMKDLLESKKEALAEHEHRKASQGQTSKGFLSSIWNTVRFQNDESSQLKQEIEALETLTSQLNRDVSDVRTQLQRTKFSGTLQGRILNMIGYLFSVYCVYKVLITFILLIFSNSSTTSASSSDPITRTLALLIGRLNLSLDVAFWSQQLNFWILGAMIFVNLRSFLTDFSKVLVKIVSSISTSPSAFAPGLSTKSKNGSSSLLPLSPLLSYVLTSYSLSSVILLRGTLPPHSASALSNHLPTLPFLFFGRWFDGIFLLSVGGTAVMDWIRWKEGKSEDETKDYDDFDGLALHDAESGRVSGGLRTQTLRGRGGDPNGPKSGSQSPSGRDELFTNRSTSRWRGGGR